MTRKPADFKSFLLNGENKKQLAEVLLKVWSSSEAAESIGNKTIILIVEGKAHMISPAEPVIIESLVYPQEESDTPIILYINYTQKAGYTEVVVRTPDSDVFILLFYAHTFNLIIMLDTESGEHRRTINITELAAELTPRMCECIMGLYIFTGEECNCAFKGKNFSLFK